VSGNGKAVATIISQNANRQAAQKWWFWGFVKQVDRFAV